MICCIYLENIDKHLLTYPATVIDNPHLYIYIYRDELPLKMVIFQFAMLN